MGHVSIQPATPAAAATASEPSWAHRNLPRAGGMLVGGLVAAKALGGALATFGVPRPIAIGGSAVLGMWIGANVAQSAARRVDGTQDDPTASRVGGALEGAALGALHVGLAAGAVALLTTGAGAALIGRTAPNVAREAGLAALRGSWKPAIAGAVAGAMLGALAPDRHSEVWHGTRDAVTGSWKLAAIGAGVGGALGGGLNLLSRSRGNVSGRPLLGALVAAATLGALAGGFAAALGASTAAAGGGLAAVTRSGVAGK